MRRYPFTSSSMQQDHTKVRFPFCSLQLKEFKPSFLCRTSADVQVTAGAVQFPRGSLFSSSPAKVCEFIHFEGQDHRESARDLGALGIDQIKEVLANPNIDIPALDSTDEQALLTCPLRPTMGGDQSMQGSFRCISSCNACNPCPYCEVSTADMCNTNLDVRFQERTQERTEILAHSRCGVCPGCSQVVDEKSKAGEGDKVPAMPKSSKEPWSKAHKGVTFGASYLIGLPSNEWVICLLHANLTQTAALWQKTLRRKTTA